MQALLHSVPPTLKPTTTDPCLHQRLMDTHGHVWVSFLWGHCSFLLGHGVYDLNSLFPQFCVSSGGSVVRLMATSSKRAYAILRSATPWAPAAGWVSALIPHRKSCVIFHGCWVERGGSPTFLTNLSYWALSGSCPEPGLQLNQRRQFTIELQRKWSRG